METQAKNWQDFKNKPATRPRSESKSSSVKKAMPQQQPQPQPQQQQQQQYQQQQQQPQMQFHNGYWWANINGVTCWLDQTGQWKKPY